MSVLADTNPVIKFHRQLPLPKPVVTMLESEIVERCISSISIIELFRLWKDRRVPLNPDDWLNEALAA